MNAHHPFVLVALASGVACSAADRDQPQLSVGSGISAAGSSGASGDDASGADSAGPQSEAGSGPGTNATSGTSDDDGPKLDVATPQTGGADGGDEPGCECENVRDGIYVLDSAGTPSVYFFDPPANTFEVVGVLGCDAPLGWTANSMAIDRQGNAWINYYNQVSETGRLFRAPLDDLGACVQQPYVPPGSGWFLLGMGYATLSPGSSCDELFIYNSDRYFEYPDFAPGGSELARYDEANGMLSIVGGTDYPVGELTGTGDARLFTFTPVGAGQAALVNLDKNTGAELENIALPGLDITNAFAFAFWGGDVYFFTETAPLSGVSKVTKLDYDESEGGGLSLYNPSAGIQIPGAGVSTCASFEPPA